MVDMWFSSKWLRLWLLQNSRERIMLICRDSVTSMRRESAMGKPCTCIVRLRGRHTERARVGTDWPISGGRQSLVLRWSGRGA